jgi:hypothetical protein
MIPKKPAPHLMRGGSQFSDKIVPNNETESAPNTLKPQGL